MLRLYHHPRSTFSRRVRLALLEKEITFEETVVDMAGREHRQPPYQALNPYGRVPAIDDDGFVLYESAAILVYLETTRPHPPLIPAGTRERALVDMHLRLCDGQFARHVGTIIYPKRFLPAARWDLAAMAQAKIEVESHLAVLDKALHGHEYLVADRFTLADLTYAPFLHFLPLMEIAPPAGVEDWSRRLLSRPSAQATVPDL